MIKKNLRDQKESDDDSDDSNDSDSDDSDVNSMIDIRFLLMLPQGGSWATQWSALVCTLNHGGCPSDSSLEEFKLHTFKEVSKMGVKSLVYPKQMASFLTIRLQGCSSLKMIQDHHLRDNWKWRETKKTAESVVLLPSHLPSRQKWLPCWRCYLLGFDVEHFIETVVGIWESGKTHPHHPFY